MSPIYNYEHLNGEEGHLCPGGPDFEWQQVAADLPLTRCPRCGFAVERVLSVASVRTHKFNCELKDLGFSKLVKVDEGIFENVTQRHGEAKYVDRKHPHTFATLKSLKD
ncbi:MAG: FmdB family zinc ribbon protein [Candidatus Adiutrix sp.]